MDTKAQSRHLVGFLATISAELDEIEKRGIEHCFGTVDETALIFKAALSYAHQIAGMGRRLALEWAGRALESMPSIPKISTPIVQQEKV
jgi:hypothetical protein